MQLHRIREFAVVKPLVSSGYNIVWTAEQWVHIPWELWNTVAETLWRTRAAEGYVFERQRRDPRQYGR